MLPCLDRLPKEMRSLRLRPTTLSFLLPTAMPLIRVALPLLLASILTCTVGHAPLGAQDPPGSPDSDPDRIRVGINFGGTGLVGVSVEYLRGNQGYEAVLGTLGFSDLSLALSAKYYLASGQLRPVVGVGAWGVAAWTEEGDGSVFLFRVPVAVEWRVSDADALGIEVGFNRGLYVNRTDPEDDTPVRKNLIPFPGAYYRHGWEQ